MAVCLVALEYPLYVFLYYLINSMSLVGDLIRKLAIISENNVIEAVNQPLLFIEAAKYRVDKMRSTKAAEGALEAFAAERAMRIRAKGTRTGEGRITDSYVKATLQKNPRYRELSAAIDDAEAKEEFSKLLLEAYRMRRDAIKIISDTNGFNAARGTAEIEREQAHKRLSNEARRLQSRRNRHEED